ncbi:DUF4190 domain-containing protein [Actinomadura xylanilytica]|uniref:DUF4190 domain-containing protein n=1 Tax=Actinomadura xylanilytica TaxID=887459 RepID=UPI00255A9650|nr:DUF4190 domain-containing protein [Actinomadura xylanilytica]MDL4773443.1 DUF4190 domain-containing protein [Actinomadura xylanilytica]
MAQPPYDPYGYGAQDPYAQQQQSYPQQSSQPVQHHYYGAGPVMPATNGMATASMVLGLVGFFSCGFTSILAIIFGHVSHSQIKRTGEGGAGMATAGLILGYIMTVGWIIGWIFYLGLWAVLVGSAASTGSTY